MTVLELFIVLGIVAGATTIVASSVPRVVPDTTGAGESLEAFVKAARLEAMRGGQTMLLEVGHGTAQYGNTRVDWPTSQLRLLVRGKVINRYLAVVSPDGVIRGPQLKLESSEGTSRVAGVYHEAVQ